MTLPDAVVILNREIERLAIKQDFITLQKLVFIKQQIITHICARKKKK